MADLVAIRDATGATVEVSSDEVTTVNGTGSLPAQQIQRVQLATVSGATATDISPTNALPVSDAGGSLSVDDAGTTLSVDDGGGSLTVDVGTALPAGTNEIGGVNQTKVAGTAVDVNSGNKSAGTQRVVLATDQPQLSNALKVDGSAVTQPVSGNVGLAAQTSGGWRPSKTISAASTNATSVKASAGQLGGYIISNNATAKRYVKFYDKATAPTVGTDAPVLTIELQPGALANVEFTQGMAFASGIAFAITAGIADSDATAVGANEVIVNLGYK